MSHRPKRWTATELYQLFLIIVIFAAACLETDIYLPAFPDIMAYFGVSETKIQWILSWNFIALCISGPIYGPLSDSFGRKGPLTVGLTLFLIGSIITAFANSFEWLLLGRVLQGLGAGGCFAIGGAIIFDAFQKDKAVLALNRINVIIPCLLGAAPMLGGFLNIHFGFRSNFIFVCLLVFISWLLFVATFKETLSSTQRKTMSLKLHSQDFMRICRNKSFWQLNLIISLLFTVYISFLSISPVLFMIGFGIAKDVYPLFQGTIIAAWLVASLGAEAMLERLGEHGMKKLGSTCLVASLILFILCLAFAARNPLLLTASLSIFALGFNWVQTPCFIEIMNIMPDLKGSVSALITSIRLLLSALAVALVGALYNGSIASFAYIFFAAMAVILPILWHRNSNTQILSKSMLYKEN